MKCLITDQPPSPQHLAVSTTTDCCQLPIHLHSWVAIGQGFNLHAVGASRSLMNSIAADRLSPKNLLRLMRSGDDGPDSSSTGGNLNIFLTSCNLRVLSKQFIRAVRSHRLRLSQSMQLPLTLVYPFRVLWLSCMSLLVVSSAFFWSIKKILEKLSFLWERKGNFWYDEGRPLTTVSEYGS